MCSDAVGHEDIHETLDEEEVMESMVVKLVKRRFRAKEVAKARIFDKEICGMISAEQQAKRESVDKRAKVRGEELEPIEEHEEKDEQEAKCVIAALKRLDLPLLRVGIWHACGSVSQIKLATSRPNLRRGRGQHGHSETSNDESEG